MFHIFSALLRRTNCPGCRDEAIAWAAERMGLSYEKLMMQLTAEEQAGLKAAYESWKNREKERKCAG